MLLAHVESFFTNARALEDGRGLRSIVVRELYCYLGCGSLGTASHGKSVNCKASDNAVVFGDGGSRNQH